MTIVVAILGYTTILHSFFVLLEGIFSFVLNLYGIFVEGCIFPYLVLMIFFYIFIEKK